MNKEDILKLIDKLTLATKTYKVSWGRLYNLFNSSGISNIALKNFVLYNERSFYMYDRNPRVYSLNQFDSYYSELEQGYVYLLRFENHKNKYFLLAVQSNRESNIIPLHKSDEYQSKLIELVFQLEGQVDNVDQYINLLINKL